MSLVVELEPRGAVEPHGVFLGTKRLVKTVGDTRTDIAR